MIIHQQYLSVHPILRLRFPTLTDTNCLFNWCRLHSVVEQSQAIAFRMARISLLTLHGNDEGAHPFPANPLRESSAQGCWIHDRRRLKTPSLDPRFPTSRDQVLALTVRRP